MKIAIGIVTYNNSQKDLARFALGLKLALKEISSEHQCTLFYVDNGDASDLKSIIPDAVPLESTGNVGYTRSINRLIRHSFENAQMDAFITANPDGAFHHSALKNFIEGHLKYPQALLEARQFPEEHPKVYDPTTLDTPWCSGCCIFIPKVIYSNVGLFDENFFMYMEDVDYSWRVRALGFQTKLCHPVLYFHMTVNRKDTKAVIRQYYVSGRYLAWKWKHSRFLRWTEKTLKNMGYTSDTLPALPQSVEPLWRKKRYVTCFSRVFTFAEKRW